MDESLSVLEQAQQLVDTIYQMTSDINFNMDEVKEGEELDVELNAYIAMVDAREPLVNQLAALSTQLEAADRERAEYDDIKQCIADIADMDKDYVAFFEP